MVARGNRVAELKPSPTPEGQAAQATEPAPAPEGAAPAADIVARLKRLWPFFSMPRWAWGVAAGATVIGALTEPMIPALLQPLLDQGFERQAIPLWLVPLALIGLFGVRGLCGFVAQMALAKVANDGILRLRKKLFERVQQADMALFGQQSASKLSNTVVYEVQAGSAMLVHSLLALVRDSLTLLFLLGYLLILNWKLTLVVAVLFPAVAWVMKTLSRRLYRITRASQSATDALAYVVEENVLAHRVVRLHGAQARQHKRFVAVGNDLRRLAMKSTAASAAMTPLTQMLAACALSAVIALALWQSSSSGQTVGSFVAFVTAMLMLIAPIKHLSEVANPITRGLAALERGLELLDHTAVELSGSHRTERADGLIEFDQVEVRYRPDPDAPPAVDGLSLQIGPGQSVALVGPSGSGKTTLVNLLPRFVRHSAGSVLLDGVPLEDWHLGNLRQQFALVSQDVVMLNDSVAANVALGSTDGMDRERILVCLRAAHLGPWLATLPDGLDTALGHNAHTLSGGQRQRLAIARALYKDAPILILDEATSALDTESERLVQEALARLMLGRTTLVIAHRLSTIERCDRIVVMAQGRIAEQGDHRSLLAAGGLYARLYQSGFADMP
jgi:ATP-binding cassette, subfamily B, bacterial MsbA